MRSLTGSLNKVHPVVHYKGRQYTLLQFGHGSTNANIACDYNELFTASIFHIFETLGFFVTLIFTFFKYIYINGTMSVLLNGCKFVKV